MAHHDFIKGLTKYVRIPLHYDTSVFWNNFLFIQNADTDCFKVLLFYIKNDNLLQFFMQNIIIYIPPFGFPVSRSCNN